MLFSYKLHCYKHTYIKGFMSKKQPLLNLCNKIKGTLYYKL